MGATGRHFSIVSNVMQQDTTECLSIFKTRKLSLDFINEKYDLNDEFESLDLSDDLSEAQNGCIKYISGFLVRKLKSSTKCNICLNTMLPSTENENCKPSLIQRKDRGGLIYPSKDLVKVCEISVKKIRETRNNRNLFYNKNILHYLCVNPIYLCWGT